MVSQNFLKVLQNFFHRDNNFISRYVKMSLIPVFIGILLNSMYDLKFSPVGTFWALLGVLTTSVYQILVHQKQKELGLDSMQLLSYQAPMSSCEFFQIVRVHTIQLILIVMLCLVLPFIENPFASDGLFNVPYSSETFGLVTLSTVAAFSGKVQLR